MFEQHTMLESLGTAEIQETTGPSIVLLNCTRNIISLVALHHIQEKVSTFTSASQGDFKQRRSCADLSLGAVYAYSHSTIDMSRAFDTIKQGKALEVLNMAGCNDDDHRLVRVLLINTHLTIRVKGTQSAWFETSLGSLKGIHCSLYSSLATSTLSRCQLFLYFYATPPPCGQ